MSRNRFVVSTVTLLALTGGIAGAQPAVIDGKITDAAEAARYGAIRWVENQPTSFGDNSPADVPPAGDASTAVTGVELVIPLSALGGATGVGDIRLTGWINSGDRGFMSNQVIGGLPNLGNLGETSVIDFTGIAGQQFITITAGSGTPVIDGVLDTAYGGPQDGWLQNNFTQFGDASHGTCDAGSGSEIDAVYALTDGTNLYLMITGNVEANFNGLDLFFDTNSGVGQSVLSASNPNINGDTLNRMAGLTFEAGFTANQYVTVQGGDDGSGTFVTALWNADLDGGTGFLDGNGGYCVTGGAVSGGDPGAPAISGTVNNMNTEGVAGSPPVTIPSRDDAVGSEIDGLFAFVDTASNQLFVLVTGNIQTVFNKYSLFFDVQPGGQNHLRGDNPDVDFNGLNRMGDDGTGNGLIFDAGFEPDYWVSIGTGGAPVQQFMNASVLRTDGILLDPGTGFPLDYGSFDGGDKAVFFPVPFAGPLAPIQDGFTPSLTANYGPRLLQLDPFNPIDGTLTGTIDNSNIEGVTATTIGNPQDVTTGFEMSIRLDEVGWDGVSDIKIAGFLHSGGYDFFSNQAIGGLPSPDQLADPRDLDLNTIAGDQFINLSAAAPCLADIDGDGDADVADFFAFVTAFAAGDPAADLNGDGSIDVGDFFTFVAAFAAGCP